MGLKDAKKAFIQALREGRVEAEPRGALSEKNLLATGDATLDEVADLIQRCRGQQYSSSPHDMDPTVEVHIFRPTKNEVSWYIKGYVLANNAVFISVHETEYGQ